MSERRCRYCQQIFRISKYQSQQTICSQPLCQQWRRSEYRRQKLASDSEYRQVCRDSAQKWRNRNRDYWKGYREQHPEAVARNREQQKARDRRQRLLDLANNTSALDLKHSAAGVWLLNPASESCKQQLSSGASLGD